MLKKYLLLLIIIAIAVSMVMNAMATMYFVTLTIVNFTTAPTDGSARLQMQFVQDTPSPIVLYIHNSTYKQEFTESRTGSRIYTAGDLITVGPVDLITGDDYYFNITFGEVVVYSGATAYYYGICATDQDVTGECQNCAGSLQTCQSGGVGNVAGNSYIGSLTIGDTSACSQEPAEWSCADEIVDTLDEAKLESFSLGFTV